jgi:hypothetical protein
MRRFVLTNGISLIILVLCQPEVKLIVDIVSDPKGEIRIKSKCRSGRAQHAAHNKKDNVGRRKTGGAGRQSVVPAATVGVRMPNGLSSLT